MWEGGERSCRLSDDLQKVGTRNSPVGAGCSSLDKPGSLVYRLEVRVWGVQRIGVAVGALGRVLSFGP